MSDETPSHRRVIEKCRETINGLLEDVCTQREFAAAAMAEVRAKEATIARLTRELAAARQECDALMPSEEEWLDAESALSMYAGDAKSPDLPAWLWALRVRDCLSRLSPSSAPAQSRALDAERTQLEVDDD